MARFDRQCMTFYYSPIVTIALSYTVCELFDVEYYHDLEMRVRDNWRSLKLVPFESLDASYSSSIVTMAVSVAVCEIFSVKEWCDLENRVRVRSRLLEIAPYDRSCTSSYLPSIVTSAILSYLRDQWRNYGRQWRQSPPGATGKGAPRTDSNVFLFCLITKFCHVLWLPMTLHSIHFAQYAHALPLTIIS